MKKIKVLQFICSSGFYGAERWVLALSKNMDKTRFESVLAITNEGGESEVSKHFAKDCGDVVEFPMKNRFDTSVVKKLAAYMKENQVDVIHTHGYKSDIIGLWAARKAGVKIVMTPHGFSTNIDLKLKMFIWLGCQMFKYADKVVPLSPQLMADMRRMKVKEENLLYIQNGVDLSEVEAQRERTPTLEKQPNEKRVGFIGQLIGRKNVGHILQVFDKLAEKDENLTLYLLGDGDQRTVLEEQAKGLKHGDNIHFLGFRDDRLEWLQSFDLFVMSSVLEGIPRCLMETMAMGVPIAAYDIAGVDQLIKDGDTGMLAKLNDVDGLADKWSSLLYDESLANTISQNALDYVQEHYSAARMAREYSELFTDMMATK